jgi:hypothetical protein
MVWVQVVKAGIKHQTWIAKQVEEQWTAAVEEDSGGVMTYDGPGMIS